MTNNTVSNKPVIVAIVGASGSGKTYASMYLQRSQGWRSIVSYTTRPMRRGEKEGREHHFTTETFMPDESEAMAMTCFGGYWYWTWRAQFWKPIQRGETMTYVVDEKGLQDLKRNIPARWGGCKVLAVKVRRNTLIDDADRLSRDNERKQLPDSEFDYILDNVGGIQDWEDILDSFAEDVRRKYLKK